MSLTGRRAYMTYVCGYQDNNINFIICDTKITWGKQSVSKKSLDVAVKSGHLFRGCIYARTGNMVNSGRFLMSAKRRIQQSDDEADFWSQFVDFIEEYPFPKKGSFTLLLSTRASGKPEFYRLDSANGLAVCESELAGLGSGTGLLNPVVEKEIRKLARHREMIPADAEDQIPVDASGYRLCQNLTLYAQSQEQSLMAQHDVGGVFHFIAQTSGQEYRQRPSLFIISVIDQSHNSIYLWMYRVAPVMGGIVLETYLPPRQDKTHPLGGLMRDSYFDYVSTEGVQKAILGGKAGKEFSSRLTDELGTLEFYYFLGWGFAHSRYRSNFGWHFLYEGDEGLVTPEGDVEEFIATEILNQIRATTNIKGTVTLYFANKRRTALQTHI